ncbi:MAG: hypothetical protein ACI9R6_001087, partial [Saprospiraceae bacterium]
KATFHLSLPIGKNVKNNSPIEAKAN